MYAVGDPVAVKISQKSCGLELKVKGLPSGFRESGTLQDEGGPGIMTLSALVAGPPAWEPKSPPRHCQTTCGV